MAAQRRPTAARDADVDQAEHVPGPGPGEPSRGARPAPRLSVDEYDQLVELGVLGEQVELIDGRVVFGRFPFAFSGEAIAAARAAGIELDGPAPRDRQASAVSGAARQPRPPFAPGSVPGWGMSHWFAEHELNAAAMSVEDRMAAVIRYWRDVADGWRPSVPRGEWVGPHDPFSHDP